MPYLLLLALVLVAAFICVQISLPVGKRSPSQTFLLIGLFFLSIGLVTELVLGFALDERAVRLFYWARGSLALAWFGQSLLLFLFPNNPRIRWLSIAVVVGSIGLFALVLISRVTAAQDWYSTAKPIHGQMGDLLATNRPTRWGSITLNLYGLITLAAGPVYLLFLQPSKRDLSHWGPPLLIALGAIMLYVPLYLTSSAPSLGFYLVELFGPVALFAGLKNFTWHSLRTGGKRKTR